MRKFLALALVSVAVVAIGARATPAPAVHLTAEVVASGLENPLAFVQDPSQSHIQLIVEQGGRVRVLRAGVLLDEPFLDLTAKTTSPAIRRPRRRSHRLRAAGVLRHVLNLDGNTVIARFVRLTTRGSARTG